MSDSIEAIYRRVPGIACKGLCSESCGPVPLNNAEYARAVEASGGPIPPSPNGVTCPLLTAEKRCSIYADRPLMCRLWGVTESMPCLWGCLPLRMLTDAEGHDLARRMNALSPGIRVLIPEWEVLFQ